LRDETEWVETVEAGWNQVVGVDTKKILAAVQKAKKGVSIPEYGQGNSAEKILIHFERDLLNTDALA